MLDPLFLISLACGIMQVVDFGCGLVSRGKEIYDSRSLIGHDDLEDLTKSVHSLDSRLLSDRTHVPLHSPQYQAFTDIATKCSQTGRELLIELHKLKIANPQSKWESLIKKPAAAIWKK